ncbi:MAG: Si-specific NAD(P)(+) transhydrogenase [Nitrospirae bacterium]|nr:MAG: Si-specific NAD(P)(+) transhydrogenase [Nitrospirota bacterium]
MSDRPAESAKKKSPAKPSTDRPSTNTGGQQGKSSRPAYDLLVIGSGPAGQKAAIQAAKLRKRVVIVEKEPEVGGSSVNTGTLPSKTLKDAIYYLHGFKLRAFPNVTYSLNKSLTLRDLMTRKDLVIKKEIEIITNQLERNDVEIVHGTASFVDPHTIQVLQRNGQVHSLQGTCILIATGSRPRRGDGVPFDDLHVCDSDSILATETLPKTLAVVGGGVIGCEYASMFAAFGIKVTLLERRKELLRFVDQEIVQALIYQMRSHGVTTKLGEEIAGVTLDERDRAVTSLKSGKTVVTDMLLYAMGRTANTDALNLPAIGLSTDPLGQLKVNEFYQTEIPHIYAAGDVIGFPGLASTSMEQGRLAACHAFKVEQSTLPKVMPYGIYTIPEISTVGKNEEELTEQGVPYEVGRAWYREIARGQIYGDLEGLLKLIFHRDTMQLLGVHIIGEGATELIHIGQAVLTYEGRVDFFVHNVFNYPTLAECYRTAALDGINRMGKL